MVGEIMGLSLSDVDDMTKGVDDRKTEGSTVKATGLIVVGSLAIVGLTVEAGSTAGSEVWHIGLDI